MKTAVLRGFARRGLCCAGFAALVEQAGSLVVGQAVVGLMPKERRLFDSVVDDGFSLAQVVARQLDESDMEPMDCSTYVWREEFRDALVEEDWDFERFQEEYLADFVAVCKDAREEHRVERLPDEELKTLALARRRSQTGLDDEGASHWDRD
ncbi:unnamed protein product [Prorocentrum cordatum]|uniref:Uncharacterized protein n=1 Tax=Prorocentrum cordatum TaxID=2364126 RepID=A0ABN9XCK3_9DINO|nr:unnamed protein product [Polarella glacialis]